MDPRLLRTLAAAAAGAFAAALAVCLVYAIHPAYTASLDTPPPAIVRGLYSTEHEADGLSFAWTRDRVTLTFEGLDRSSPWTLALRVRAGRGSGLPLPQATLDVDGVTRATVPIGAAWQDVRVELPANPSLPPGRPTRVTVNVAPTFVPGPGDTRALGMILDDVRLVPASRLPLAPRRALAAAAIAGGLVSAALAGIGVPLAMLLALTGVFAIGQALMLAGGAGPFTRPYLDQVPWVALFTIVPLAALAAGITLQRTGGLSAAAASAIGVSCVAPILELEGLLHPSKALVDALFHAHRLEWVLEGRYFFTQPMPSGVEFPYAIGLYVTAMPWASLVGDHVLLLRIVVIAAHALAGLALYPLVVRRWASPGAAVAAVAAYHLAPLPLVVIGNANQTYAFGQSVATIALASAMTWPLGWRRLLDMLGLTALIALGLLSHVGLIPLLGGLLGACALLVALRGDPVDRPAGWTILASAALAAVLAVGLYYAHFGDAFRSAQRVGQTQATPGATAEVSEDGQLLSRADTGTSRPARIRRAVLLGMSGFGLPMLALAAVGVTRLRPRTDRDRLSLMVTTTLMFAVVVTAAAVLAPVEPRFERYTDEFISRLYYAVLPAVAIGAGAGAAWLWPRAIVGRGAALVLGGAALVTAARVWLGWTW